MKAIMKTKPGPGLELREVEVPQIKDDEVLIRVKKRAICGTDLHIYHWDRWSSQRIKPPVIIGHEFYGEIAEVGRNVKDFKEGDLVTAEMHVVCGKCEMCRTGKAHLCENVIILGVDGNGAFADYVAVPASNLWKIHPEINEEFYAIYDPYGNAVHTVFSGEVAAKTVMILGCGPIGIAAVAIAKAAGASAVYASEVNEYRAELARKMGADLVINPKKENLIEIIMDLTHGEGVDVVLEMSGHPEAIRQGFKIIKKAGRMSLLGIPSEPVTIDLSEDVIFKGIEIQGINGRKMFETWYQMDALLLSGKVDLSPLITHRFPMEKFEEAMKLMETGNCGKIILE